MQNAQTDPSLRWAHSHFAGFVMSRLSFVFMIVFQPLSFDIRTKLSLMSHEHEDIMSLLQTLAAPKTAPKDGQLLHDILQTLKYIKEKLDLPGCKPKLNGSGATYIRWGRTECPDVNGTQKVYDGFAAGDHYTHPGGPVELLCLPSEPAWGKYNDAYLGHSFVYGVEYEVRAMTEEIFGENIHDKNVPCVVCQSIGRVSALRIPGRVDCFEGWIKEYDGYLMGEHHDHKKSSDYTCVDSHPEVIQGNSQDQDGRLLYFVEANCHSASLPCPPYVHGREIPCVICTKWETCSAFICIYTDGQYTKTLVQHVRYLYEPRHEKTCFCHMRTTKTQISLRIHAVWSAPLFFAARIV